MGDYSNIHDLTSLNEIDEASILNVLKERFKGNSIYTSLGNSVIVKVNPFSKLKRNGSSVGKDELETNGKPMPHVARLARNAREKSIASGLNQACVMTGESGSGKTEATKVYLAALAGTKHCSNESLHVQLVDSCTLLESFGNCATEHNKNSSRFARWFELGVNRNIGKITSGHVKQYLLEKARIVNGSKTSSNFHVLNDLCATIQDGDSSAEDIEQTAEHFQYLQNRINTGQEARWLRMQAQLMRLGVDEEGILGVEETLWTILHLGNLIFEDDKENHNGSTIVESSKNSLKCVSELLGMGQDVSQVERFFTTKTLQTGKESIEQPRSASQASDARDALAKDLYSKLFKWVVATINQTISDSKAQQKQEEKSRKTHVSIGLLDVFGFECFEQNSFEQLCINYCNERLVEQFHEVLVQEEVNVCVAEGVPAAQVGIEQSYKDEQAHKAKLLLGIDTAFSIIQDETRLPRATDKTLTVKLLKLELGKLTKESRMHGTTKFSIQHYAGPVTYCAQGFLEKNKDEGPVDIEKAISAKSSKTFLKNLFAKYGDNGNTNKNNDQKQSSPTRKGNKKKKTLGMQFRDEFSLLAKALRESEQQFVMCVKPNRKAQAKVFEDELVLRQLECNGLLSVCKVRKSAYAAHVPHDKFILRFGLICPQTRAKAKSLGNNKKLVQAMFDEMVDMLLFEEDEAFVGKTRVLLRQSALVALNIKLKFVSKRIIKIQTFVRMILASKKFQRNHRAIVTIQSVSRGFLARKHLEDIRAKSGAAKRIQAWTRMALGKQRFKNLKEQAAAVVILQSFARMIEAKQQLVHLRLEKKIEMRFRALVTLQMFFRRIQKQQRMKILNQKVAAIKIQSLVRQSIAKRVRSRLAVRVFVAIKLQSLFRRRRASRKVKMLRLRFQAETAATEQKRKLEEEKNELKRRLEQEKQSETQRKREKIAAAAAVGVAAAVATATASNAQAAVAKNSVSIEQPPVSDEFNQRLLARPVIPKGRKRTPTKRSNAILVANEEPQEEEEEMIVEDSPQEEQVEEEEPKQEEEQQQEEEEEIKEMEEAIASPPVPAKPKNMLNKMKLKIIAATKIQSMFRGWKNRRNFGMKCEQVAWEKNLENQEKRRLKESQRFNEHLGKNSAAFFNSYGRTEEEHYEQIARNRPEFQYLVVERKEEAYVSHASKQMESRARKELVQALKKREFGALSSALSFAFEVQYNGPEVERAHAVVSHIRKVHLKQLEAERVLAEKLGLRY